MLCYVVYIRDFNSTDTLLCYYVHITNNLSLDLVEESLIRDYHDGVQNKGLSLMLKPLKLETQHSPVTVPYNTIQPQILYNLCYNVPHLVDGVPL